MGLLDIIKIGLELEKRKNEFLRNNDKDNYIKYLESKNDDLMKEIREIIVENEDLTKKLEEFDNTNLSSIHLEILRLFIENGDNLIEPIIKKFVNNRVEYEIAFSELRDWEYIKECLFVKNVYNPRPDEFYFNNDHKTEVLKLLAKK